MLIVLNGQLYFVTLIYSLYVRCVQLKKTRRHSVIIEIIVPTFMYQRVEMAVINKAIAQPSLLKRLLCSHRFVF